MSWRRPNMRAMGRELGNYVAMIASKNRPPLALDGVIVDGSWDPVTSTAEVIIGSTFAIPQDDDVSQPMVHRLPVFTACVGIQSGPIGGERVTIVPRESGWIILFEHGDDDSPGAPAGEHWITHRNPTTKTVDATVKMTNDGPGDGDGLGGTFIGDGGALTKIGTSDDTLQSAYDATAGTLTHQAGDVAKVVHDKTLGQVGIGDHPANLPDDAKAIVKSHLSSYDSSLLDARLQDQIKMANLLHAAAPSAITSASLTTMLAALVSGWANAPTVPDGSAITKIKT